ncbi:DUF732 domain-containing protein, partial [Mycobacterium intracellulare]|uniref:DUF732 domain-containing protein n=1 Tax=Mycobacterium intracellulare TaxID=1767 RepID=UPI001F27599A
PVQHHRWLHRTWVTNSPADRQNGNRVSDQRPFWRSGRVLVLILGVLVLIAAVVGAVILSQPDYNSAERTYLDVVKADPEPDYHPWPEDDVLVAQGHRICADLRNDWSPLELSINMSTEPEHWGNHVTKKQAMSQIGSAIGALCADQRRWLKS